MPIVKHTDNDTHCGTYTVSTAHGDTYVIEYDLKYVFDTTCIVISRVEQFGWFIKRDNYTTVSVFEYDNTGQSPDKWDLSKLSRALESQVGQHRVIGWERTDTIALIFARAIALCDVAALSVITSFASLSWEGKASALIALDDMYANYEKRVEQQKQQSEDVVLEQKILALQSYGDMC